MGSPHKLPSITGLVRPDPMPDYPRRVGVRQGDRPVYSLEPLARTQPYPRRNAINELDAGIFKSVKHCDQISW